MQRTHGISHGGAEDPRPSSTAPGSLRFGAAEYRWVRQLRSNCETLYDISPNLLSALSVFTPLESGTPSQALLVRELARHLAEEFDFVVSMRITETHICVRFSRMSDPRAWRNSKGPR